MSAARNSLIYISFSVLQKSISFVLLPILTYFLSSDSMGRVTLLTALVPILSLYCGLVLYGAGTAFTYKYKDETKIRQLWGNINLFTNIFGIAFVSIMLLIYPLVKEEIFEGLNHNDFMIILGIVFFSSVYTQYQSYLQARKKVKEFTRNALGFTTVNVLLVILCVVVLKLGYQGYFYAIFLTNLVFYFYVMYHARKNFNFTMDRSILKDCLKYALPLLPHLTFAMSLSYIDRIFVNKYLGISEVGIYGVACQFAVIFSLVINGFNQSYSPFCYENIESKNYTGIREFCYKTLVIFSVVVVVVSLFAKEIFYIVVNHGFFSGWVVLPLFAIAYLFQLGYIFFVNNVFYHRPGLVNIVTIASGSLNVVLNIYLTKYFGIIGATSCTIVSYLVSMILVYNISMRLENLGFNFFKLMLYYSVVIIFALLTYVSNYSDLPIYKSIFLNSVIGLISVYLLIKFIAPTLLGVDLKFTDIKFKRIK